MEFALGIHAYTLREPSIYAAVNHILNSEERIDTESEEVKAALRFTKFIDEALEQLPSYEPLDGQPYVYRGIKHSFEDFHSRFAVGTAFPWYTLKSAATDPRVMDKFCGRKGPRTVFEITVRPGDSDLKDISWLSAYPEEKEVLAPPLTMFEVQGSIPRDPENHQGPPLETADLVKLVEIDLFLKQWQKCIRDAEAQLSLNMSCGSGIVGAEECDQEECLQQEEAVAWKDWSHLGGRVDRMRGAYEGMLWHVMEGLPKESTGLGYHG